MNTGHNLKNHRAKIVFLYDKSALKYNIFNNYI